MAEDDKKHRFVLLHAQADLLSWETEIFRYTNKKKQKKHLYMFIVGLFQETLAKIKDKIPYLIHKGTICIGFSDNLMMMKQALVLAKKCSDSDSRSPPPCFMETSKKYRYLSGWCSVLSVESTLHALRGFPETHFISHFHRTGEHPFFPHKVLQIRISSSGFRNR